MTDEEAVIAWGAVIHVALGIADNGESSIVTDIALLEEFDTFGGALNHGVRRFRFGGDRGRDFGWAKEHERRFRAILEQTDGSIG